MTTGLLTTGDIRRCMPLMLPAPAESLPEELPSLSLFSLWHTSGIAATATINTLTIAGAAAAENVIIRAGVLRGDDGQVRYV